MEVTRLPLLQQQQLTVSFQNFTFLTLTKTSTGNPNWHVHVISQLVFWKRLIRKLFDDDPIISSSSSTLHGGTLGDVVAPPSTLPTIAAVSMSSNTATPTGSTGIAQLDCKNITPLPGLIRHLTLQIWNPFQLICPELMSLHDVFLPIGILGL